VGIFKVPLGNIVPKPFKKAGHWVLGRFFIDKTEFLKRDNSLTEYENSNFEEKFIMVKSGKGTRLSKIAKEFNVGITTIVDFLHKKGLDVDSKPNSKVPAEYYDLLLKEYRSDSEIKKESDKLIRSTVKKETISLEEEVAEEVVEEVVTEKVVEKVEEKPEPVEEKKPEPVEEKPTPKEEPEIIEVKEEVIPEPKTEEPVAVIEEKETIVEVKEEAKPEEKEIVKEKTLESEEEKEKPKTKKKKEKKEETPVEEPVKEETKEEIAEKDAKEEEVKIIGKIDLESLNQKSRPAKKTKKEKEKERKEKEIERKGKSAKAKKDKQPTKEKIDKIVKIEKLDAKKEEIIQPKAKVEDKIVKKVVKDSQSEEAEFKVKKTVLQGPTVLGKIELPVDDKKKKKSTSSDPFKKKKKRKRIKKERVDIKKDGTKSTTATGTDKKSRRGKPKKRVQKTEVSEEDVQKQIKDTLARLTNKGKSKASKYRRTKREDVRQRHQKDLDAVELEKGKLKVSEFVSVNELASMMDIAVNEIISVCMNLGLFVSINQRLDAETMTLVADEFGFEVEFMSADFEESLQIEEDKPEDLVSRSPIVTVMGHVDHGKTSLLDYIRKTNVISGEAGGITQHIGAYSVELTSGKKITFLDTPGHEAFTAMRARGAKVTDIVIIVVAADDNVMPQTVEAINHASSAGVPIVFAINKIDKPGANPDKIKEELANMNYMVEEWGGKYQSQDISAKQGLNIEELLEKVLLEAEMLDLKGNPSKPAHGSVVESSLDKGRGYVATVLVESGTLKIGDILLAGSYTGHVKAMFNERGTKFNNAGPSMPALILGLNGAPQAGDKFNVMESEREARDVANKRDQLHREQSLRTNKHITLDEIGRRLALGDFHEINVIVKGDVDGSIEALSGSLIKLSTDSVQVNIIHKAVGQISETDIMLASASNAIVVGFQVRPSLGARQLAEKEQIDIRLYSIIYDAINELKEAMEGMLSPEKKEEIVATLEIRETFKITKVGTIAGCIVKSGKIKRSTQVRVIREGIVVYTGELGSLKRFKDDVKEVAKGYECGLNIANFNDIKAGDIVEGYTTVDVKRTL